MGNSQEDPKAHLAANNKLNLLVTLNFSQQFESQQLSSQQLSQWLAHHRRSRKAMITEQQPATFPLMLSAARSRQARPSYMRNCIASKYLGKPDRSSETVGFFSPMVLENCHIPVLNTGKNSAQDIPFEAVLTLPVSESRQNVKESHT